MIFKRMRPPIELIIPYIRECIKAGQNVKLAVTGNSMYPLLRGNSDAVFLTKPVDLKKYDVVLFRRADGDYVLHRIILIKDDIMTISGDAEIKKEYPVFIDDCIGKMTAFERRGKLHTTDDFSYKLYSRFWLLVFPLRRIIIAFLKKGRRLLSKVITLSNG